MTISPLRIPKNNLEAIEEYRLAGWSATYYLLLKRMLSPFLNNISLKEKQISLLGDEN
jgi:hypothetical protein